MTVLATLAFCVLGMFVAAAIAILAFNSLQSKTSDTAHREFMRSIVPPRKRGDA